MLRCSNPFKINLSAFNTGTKVSQGIQWIRLDEVLLDQIPGINADTILTPNIIGFVFDSLTPRKFQNQTIEMEIPSPPVSFPGDTLNFSTWVELTDPGQLFIQDTFALNGLVRCSYDPNDKLVEPSRENGYTLYTEDLYYTIRFQNTGNDTAFRVEIRDVLDQKIIPESFKLLGTSHPDQLNIQIQNDRILSFIYENINLVDSATSWLGSQGFVSFKAKFKDDLPYRH